MWEKAGKEFGLQRLDGSSGEHVELSPPLSIHLASAAENIFLSPLVMNHFEKFFLVERSLLRTE